MQFTVGDVHPRHELMGVHGVTCALEAPGHDSGERMVVDDAEEYAEYEKELHVFEDVDHCSGRTGEEEVSVRQAQG